MKNAKTMPPKNDRIYAERDTETGELVWFFYTREGEFGYYSSEDLARESLIRHIERCKQNNLDGARAFELSRTKPVVQFGFN